MKASTAQKWTLGLLIALVVGVGGLGLLAVNEFLAPTQASQEVSGFSNQAFQTEVYLTDGGDRLVVSSGGTLQVDAGATFTQAGNTFPIIYCATSATFTETTTIDFASQMTTVSQVLATQITTPAATGSILTVSAPTTSTVVLSSWESDFTAGTTGITAHYCAFGQ